MNWTHVEKRHRIARRGTVVERKCAHAARDEPRGEARGEVARVRDRQGPEAREGREDAPHGRVEPGRALVSFLAYDEDERSQLGARAQEVRDSGEEVAAAGAPRRTTDGERKVPEEGEGGGVCAELRCWEALDGACEAERVELPPMRENVGKGGAVGREVSRESDTGEVAQREGIRGKNPGHVVKGDGAQRAVLDDEGVRYVRVSFSGGIRKVVQSLTFELR
jgi:hypothetical protein